MGVRTVEENIRDMYRKKIAKLETDLADNIQLSFLYSCMCSELRAGTKKTRDETQLEIDKLEDIMYS